MAIPRCCGTCQSIRYKGPQELYQESGLCAKSKDSGRVYIRFDMEPCPCWHLRSKRVREQDVAKQAAMGRIVTGANQAMKGRKRKAND